MYPPLLVLTNLPDLSEAERIGRDLVSRQLAACVNILPGVRSIYRWQGNLEEAAEVTLLIKTRQSRYADVEAAIKASHPYEVPEIIAIPIAAGYAPYLRWIDEETEPKNDAQDT